MNWVGCYLLIPGNFVPEMIWNCQKFCAGDGLECLVENFAVMTDDECKALDALTAMGSAALGAPQAAVGDTVDLTSDISSTRGKCSKASVVSMGLSRMV